MWSDYAMLGFKMQFFPLICDILHYFLGIVVNPPISKAQFHLYRDPEQFWNMLMIHAPPPKSLDLPPGYVTLDCCARDTKRWKRQELVLFTKGYVDELPISST